MSFRKAPSHIPTLETRYEGRYPSLADLTRQGGIPGYKYYLVHGGLIGHYQALGGDLVAGLPAFEIVGPKGTATAFLMCVGKPIPGANPLNGIREYAIDPNLDEITGLHPQESNDAPQGKLRENQGKQEDSQGDARVQSGNVAEQQRNEGHKPRSGGRDSDVRTAQS